MILEPGLQLPSIRRRRALLLALQVNLGHLGVDAHRVQPLVAEQVLRRLQVAAVAQEIDGEGVAETMNPTMQVPQNARNPTDSYPWGSKYA